MNCINFNIQPKNILYICRILKNKMNKIKFAIIGCGHIGKRHAEMITRNNAAELVALCDIAPQETLNIDHFNVPLFNSIEDLLASGLEFDILNIATPNGWHYEHTMKGLEANKHIVCEKPMALSKADCEDMISKSLSVGKKIFCVMQNRYSPPSEWLKEVVSNKLLGTIFLVQVNCYWNRDEHYYKPGSWHGNLKLDGGTLFTQFSHFIDIMYWLFGDITNISARFNDFNHSHLTDFEDSGLVQFDFKKEGMGCINYSTSVWDSNLESSLTIIGSKGSIKVGGQYMNEVVHCNIENYTMPVLKPSNPANDYGKYKGSAANHNYIIDNVIDTIQNNAVPTTNALEGLKVVEIIENIYALKRSLIA